MNELEIQRGLRAMNAPREPAVDLWQGIAARIAAETEQATTDAAKSPSRRRWLPFALAAGTLLAATGASLLGLRIQEGTGIAQQTVPLQKFSRITPAQALDAARAPGGDPRLAGAAVVLDAANAELQQALEQQPDAVFLVSLLNRTNARRMKLEHYGARAG